MGVLKPIKVRREVEDEVIGDNGEENQPLSPMAQLFHRPECNVYIIVMIGFKKKIDPEILKANVADTLPKQPRFSSLQVMDEATDTLKWVPTEVDLDNHFVVPSLDESTIDSPEKYVENYIYNLSKTTIDMSKPMWDIHVLNLKTSDAESVALLRVHHSLGDGNSLVSLLLACTRRVSYPDKLPTVPSSKKFGFSRGSKGGFWRHLIRLWFALLVIRNTTIDVIKFIATALTLLTDAETPIKPARKVESTPRRFVRRTISMDDIKYVKNATNATINDVVLGIIEAGLSRYLNRKYGESKFVNQTSEGDDNLPLNINLRTTVFMNIRPSSGIHELADMMKKGSKARWGNHIGYVLVPNTIAIRDDPLDYVRYAKAKMDRKKASLEASFSYYLAKYSLKYFGDKLASFPSQTSLWFSNIQGPLEEISYYGLPVSYICGSCYGLPTALLIHVVSYADKMSIVLSVDDTVIPDHQNLRDDFEEALKLMKSAATAKGSFA